MMYFRPKKKGLKVDFGRIRGKDRNVVIPMSNIVEVDYKNNKACVKSSTGAVMIYHGGGVMNMNNKEIAKLVANDNFHMTNEYKFYKLK